jgi:hypothetical protein
LPHNVLNRGDSTRGEVQNKKSASNIVTCWGLVLKCFGLRTRQHIKC